MLCTFNENVSLIENLNKITILIILVWTKLSNSTPIIWQNLTWFLSSSCAQRNMSLKLNSQGEPRCPHWHWTIVDSWIWKRSYSSVRVKKVPDCSISSALALEILQSGTKPSIQHTDLVVCSSLDQLSLYKKNPITLEKFFKVEIWHKNSSACS